MASKKPQIRPSVRHPSHNHPLRGHKTKFEDEIICFGCNLDLIGASYKCTKSVCDYFLHKSCFELPREIHHKSHPNHALTLLHFPPYDHSTYKCNACGEYGSRFTYNCSICQYDVHVGCVSMAESMKHEDHAHPLDLVYSSLYRNDLIAICDVCHENIPHNLWSYFCQRCNYNTHLHSCIDEEKKEPFVADEDDEPRVADEEEESCVPNEEEHPCVIVENEQRCVTVEEEESCVVIEEEGSCIPYEEEQPCVAVEEEQRCIAIEEEEPCISDEKEEPCIAVEEEEPCVPDEEEQPCVAVEGEHPCVAVEEEQRCITVEEEQPCVAVEEEQQCIEPCVADEEEEPCVADEEEEPCVADEEEEPGNEGRIRKRDVIRVVANIASTVMGYGPLF